MNNNVLVCPNCGASSPNIEESVLFCPYCGTKYILYDEEVVDKLQDIAKSTDRIVQHTQKTMSNRRTALVLLVRDAVVHNRKIEAVERCKQLLLICDDASVVAVHRKLVEWSETSEWSMRKMKSKLVEAVGRLVYALVIFALVVGFCYGFKFSENTQLIVRSVMAIPVVICAIVMIGVVIKYNKRKCDNNRIESMRQVLLAQIDTECKF